MMRISYILVFLVLHPFISKGMQTSDEQIQELLTKAKLAETQEAISLYDSAYKIALDKRDSIFILTALAEWGELVLNQRDPTKVINRLDSIDYKKFIRFQDPAYKFLKVYNRAHGLMSNHEKVLEISQELLNLNNQLFDELNADRVDFTYYIGMMQANLFIRDKGLINLKKALGLSIKFFGEKTQRTAVLYNNIGIVYKSMSDFENALIYYSKTVELVSDFDPNNYGALATLKNNVSGVLLEKEAFDQALKYNDQAIAYNQKLEQQNHSIYLKRGQIYQALDSNGLALAQFHIANELLSSQFPSNHPRIASGWYALGDGHLRLKNYDSASYYFNKVISSALSPLQFDYDSYDSRVNLGKIAIEKGNPNEAIDNFNKAISMVSPEYKPTNFWDLPSVAFIPYDYMGLMLETALVEKGKALHQLGVDEKNIRYLEKSLQHYELILEAFRIQINSAGGQDLKLSLSKESQPIYAEALAVCFDLYEMTDDEKYPKKAHQIIEGNKAYILYQNLVSSGRMGKVIPDSVQINLSTQKLTLEKYKKEYYDLIASSDVDSAKLNLVRNKIIASQQQVELLSRKIREHYSDYFKFQTDIKHTDLDQLLQNVPSGMLVLQFFELGKSYYVVKISSSNVSLEFIENPELTEQPLRKLPLASFKNKSYKLYQTLLSPFLKDEKEVNNLVILPDGHISQIPFELLLTQPAVEGSSYANLPYLIKEVNVTYHYSTSLMDHFKTKRKVKDPSVLAYAPVFNKSSNALLATRSAADSILVQDLVTLPEAQNEAKQIVQLLGGELRAGADATESHFKNASNTASILHMATHSLINSQNPMYSRLVFSNNNNSDEDGLLHTYEIYNMNINANLVSLSACNTGIGKYYDGEGVMSLARAFMYAGVPNVMTSLWSVPDKSTSEIMTSFYKHLQDGKGKADALRQAKLDYLATADDNTSAPYYWAGFVYIGNPEPQKGHSNLWFGLAVALIVITVLIAVKKRQKSK